MWITRSVWHQAGPLLVAWGLWSMPALPLQYLGLVALLHVRIQQGLSPLRGKADS